MPDFQSLVITRIGSATLTVPRWTVSARIIDSQTGVLVRDFTGANAQTFPNILSSLTNAEQDEFVEMSVNWLLRKRAGIA